MRFDYSGLFEHYRETLKHEDDARRVSWRIAYGQELRFENLLEAIDDSTQNLHILDVGCGLGDLFGYLKRTGRTSMRYTGVDICEEMVLEAQQRHPDATFLQLDILQDPLPDTYDFVLCSGALSVRIPEHTFFVQAMIARMVHIARKAVAINFLSKRHFERVPAHQDEGLYYADPLNTYTYCRSLSRFSTLREDALASDFTIYMYPAYARSIERYAQLPSPPPDPFGTAWLYLERYLPNEALEVLNNTPTDDSPPLLNLLGVAHQQLKNKRLARRFYNRALKLDPSYAPARLNLEGL